MILFRDISDGEVSIIDIEASSVIEVVDISPLKPNCRITELAGSWGKERFNSNYI